MTRNPRSDIVIPTLALLASMPILWLLVPGPGTEQQLRLPPARSKPKAVKAVYNPHPKRYFELPADLPEPSTWQILVIYARTKSLKDLGVASHRFSILKRTVFYASMSKHFEKFGSVCGISALSGS